MPTTPLFIPHKKADATGDEVQANFTAVERWINDAPVSVSVFADVATTRAVNLGYLKTPFNTTRWDYYSLVKNTTDLRSPGNGLFQINTAALFDLSLIAAAADSAIAMALTVQDTAGGITFIEEILDIKLNTLKRVPMNISAQFHLRKDDLVYVQTYQNGGTATYTIKLLNLDMVYIGPFPLRNI